LSVCCHPERISQAWVRTNSQPHVARPYPPRTITVVDRLDEDDIVEVGTFDAPPKR
jgi:hypothetical protein